MEKFEIIIPWLSDLKTTVERIKENNIISDSLTNEYPMVSIVVANYNRASHIPYIIESIKKQDYPGKIELIFVDDRSKDESISVLQTFNNVNIYRLAHNFGSEALPQNIGMYFAKGEYIAFLDSDDYLLTSNAITSLVSELKKNRDAVLAVSNVIFQIEEAEVADGMKWVLPNVEFAEHIDLNRVKNCMKVYYPEKTHQYSIRRARNWSVFDLMVRGYHIGFRMARKQQLMDLGGWPLELKKDDDYGMLLNVAAYGYKNDKTTILPVDLHAYVYRINAGNASINESEDQSAMRNFCLAKIKYLGLSYQDLLKAVDTQIAQGHESVINRWNFIEREILS